MALYAIDIVVALRGLCQARPCETSCASSGSGRSVEGGLIDVAYLAAG